MSPFAVSGASSYAKVAHNNPAIDAKLFQSQGDDEENQKTGQK
jgi:hypothetical protein